MRKNKLCIVLMTLLLANSIGCTMIYAAPDIGTATGPENIVNNGKYATVLGGNGNVVDGECATVVGGSGNTIETEGEYSFIGGGVGNDICGSVSTIIGGGENIAAGDYSFIGGASSSNTYGSFNTIVGGEGNIALGDNTFAGGGSGSVVRGRWSSGIGGGSTGENARYATAIGRESLAIKEYGLALGYQSVQNVDGTISFGHDVGDISEYDVTWQTDDDGNVDYNKIPTITECTYDSAYYNRLVKVADGIDDHDVATVGQVKAMVATGGGSGTSIKASDDISISSDNTISIAKNGQIASGDSGIVTLLTRTCLICLPTDKTL